LSGKHSPSDPPSKKHEKTRFGRGRQKPVYLWRGGGGGKAVGFFLGRGGEGRVFSAESNARKKERLNVKGEIKRGGGGRQSTLVGWVIRGGAGGRLRYKCCQQGGKMQERRHPTEERESAYTTSQALQWMTGLQIPQRKVRDGAKGVWQKPWLKL